MSQELKWQDSEDIGIRLHEEHPEQVPLTAEEWFMAALLRDQDRRLDDALDAYTRSHELDADALQTLQNRGELLYRLGRYPAAPQVRGPAAIPHGGAPDRGAMARSQPDRTRGRTAFGRRNVFQWCLLGLRRRFPVQLAGLGPWGTRVNYRAGSLVRGAPRYPLFVHHGLGLPGGEQSCRLQMGIL